MIVVRLCCGLGNQMFQYALGRHLAEKNNHKLRIDTSWWDQQYRYGKGKQPLTLFEYDISGQKATEDDVNSVLRYPQFSSWMRGNQDIIRSPVPEIFKFNLDYIPRLFPRFVAEKFNLYREVRGEPSSDVVDWAYRCRFHPEILEIEEDAYLDGYWHTPQYFEDIGDIIRNEFSVRDPLPGKNATVADEIATENTPVSIHIRRGDQTEKGPKSDEMGNTLPVDYQQQAADYIAERVEDPVFYLFSDSIGWATKHLNLSYPVRAMDQNDGETAYLDIELMSRCDHHIVANSTFSWWGAWLNDSESKLVTVPFPWHRYGYPTGTILQWELFPDAWNIIDYRSGTIVNRN